MSDSKTDGRGGRWGGILLALHSFPLNELPFWGARPKNGLNQISYPRRTWTLGPPNPPWSAGTWSVATGKGFDDRGFHRPSANQNIWPIKRQVDGS